jgi:predicted RNA polymerase sigma factor
MAELELRRGHREDALELFRAALAIARNDAERHFLEKRLLVSSDA